jgi:Flp pilus assembly protein TadD
VILRGMKRPAEAEAAFREAIRLDPASAPAHTNLGAICARRTGQPRPKPPSGRRSAWTRP